MKIDEKNSLMFSRIGSRATYGLVLLDLLKKNDKIIAITADTSTSAGLDRIKKTFPENYLDVGISEQNLIGVAAGLSSEGYQVFTSTFAPFQTMRCLEQIRVNLGYMQHKICMVGLASGLVLGTLGYTHCCIEDLAIMRSVPNLTVLSPADCSETAKAVHAALEHDGPSYIRLTGGPNNPIVFKKDYEFKIGKGISLRDGSDIGIFATGTMVHVALKVAEYLEEKKISTSITNIHTIKPFDEKIVQEISKKVKLVVTIEEHGIIGGLGSCVAEARSKILCNSKHLPIGLPQEFGKSEVYKDMLNTHGLTSEKIFLKIKENFS